MQLTLCVPGLLLPRAVLAATVFDLDAPALSLLLGRGRRAAADPDWLAAAFGLAAPLPAAALRKVSAGGTADGTWLCLDPVHWAVGREGITLADVRPDAAEAAALIEALRPLCADWGELSASTPARWELRLARPLALETRPLPDCLGQRVDPGLPGGPDGAAWRRLIAEAQTLLHAHKVNREREAHGRPAINSLWPWGAGALPASARCEFDVVWSGDPALAGLCHLAGVPCLAPPERHQPASGRVLCVIDALAGPARARDALAWRAALLALERDWLAPAVAALRRGECDALRIVGGAVHEAPRAALFALARGDLWRFWRRPAHLEALA
ncbi:MAG: hypothetical protein AB1642_10305 [Pseudomonadota bacterium]